MFVMYRKFIECGVLKHTDNLFESSSLIGVFSSAYNAISHAIKTVREANESYGEHYPREEIDKIFGDITVEVDEEGVFRLSCEAMQFVICEFKEDEPQEIMVEYRYYVNDKKEVKN